MAHTQTWRERSGHLLHDGDCYWFSSHVCTCGLLHYLQPREDCETLFPQVNEQMPVHTRMLREITELRRSRKR